MTQAGDVVNTGWSALIDGDQHGYEERC